MKLRLTETSKKTAIEIDAINPITSNRFNTCVAIEVHHRSNAPSTPPVVVFTFQGRLSEPDAHKYATALKFAATLWRWAKIDNDLVATFRDIATAKRPCVAKIAGGLH